MRTKTSYPYILEKEEDSIKLRIMPKKTYGFFSILYIAIMVMSAISIIGCILSVFLIDSYASNGYSTVICIIIACILFFLFALYLLRWRGKGEEIFILYPDKLENIVIIRPFRTERHIFIFNKLEIGYQPGEDFFCEEGAKLLGVELDIDKVEGNYPIQFYMDDGKQIVDSEREIPIEIIRRIKKEFLLIRNKITHGL